MPTTDKTSNRAAREGYGWTITDVASLARCRPEDVVQYEGGARYVDRPSLLDFLYAGLRGIALGRPGRRRSPKRS